MTSATADNLATPPHAAPVVRGLSTWPANPPAFDPIDIVSGAIKVPVSLRPATESTRPQMQAGRRVTTGQALIEANILGQQRARSPIDGIIQRATEAMLFDGTRVDAIEVAVAEEAHRPPETGATASAPGANLDLAALFDRVCACGVGAARHDSPNLQDQLALALKRPVDSVICTVLDVDPTACVQAAWAANHPADLIAGVAALAKACGASRRLIVLNERAPSRWWNKLRSAVRTADRQLRIVELENDYPQADPSLLLYTLLGRRLRPGRLPVEQGVLLLDAVAATAIGACLVRDEPMLRVPLCVRDHDRAESYFLLAAQGTSILQILVHLGLAAPENSQPPLLLRGGDVLRDCRIDASAVVSGSELLLQVSTPPRSRNPDPCIRCAWCFEACPTRIQPANLLEAAQREDLSMGHRAGLQSCIECGICSYVCPSHLPLLDGIRGLRRYERTIQADKSGG